MSTPSIEYRLPVTLVTIAGTRTTATNPMTDPREVRTRVAEIGVEIAADPGATRSLSLDPSGNGTRSMTVSLARDGRLTGINSSLSDESGERVKAALTVGASTVGALTPFLAPLGPVGAGVAVLAGLAAAGVTKASLGSRGAGLRELTGSALVPLDAETELEPVERPGASELGIKPAYLNARALDAERLADLRWSEILLETRLAKASTDAGALADPSALADELKRLGQALTTVRASLAEAETAYEEWIKDQTTVTAVDHFREVFTVDELPTERELRRAAEREFPEGQGAQPRWVRLARNLRVAVSVDLLPEGTPAPAGSGSSASGDKVLYRRPQLARVTRWTVSRDGRGNYALTPDSVERLVVVRRGTEEALPLKQGRDDLTVEVEFDDDGLLSKVSSQRGDAATKRAQLVAGSPALIQDALETGGALTKGWTTADRAAALKAELELHETRGKLDAALGPKPAKTPLDLLRAEVEETELQARLQRAKVLVSEPTRSLHLLRVVTTN